MKALNVLALAALFTGLNSYGACAPEDFVTSDAATVTVGIEGRAYSPRCLKVKTGTVVTILASSGHPLQGVENLEGPVNPFHRGSAATAPDTQTLMESGGYHFFCVRHGDNQGNGMAGTILAE